MISYDLRILWANQAGAKSWAIGKLCYEEFQSRGEPCTMCPVKAMLNSGKGGVEEKWISFANGSGRWFEVKTYPIFDQEGQILCAFKICFDVTHRRHTLEKKKNYIETLERTLKQIRRGIPRTTMNPRGSADRNTRLSSREMEVLKLVTEGFTNSQVSQILSISVHTVKSHIINIFNKLGVSDRTQAAVQAIRLGII